MEEYERSGNEYVKHACQALGYCYSRLGEYEKAVGCHEQMIDNWPDYEYAYDSTLQVGLCYEVLARTKQVSRMDSADKICAACERQLMIKGIEAMKNGARAAKNIGIKVVNGFINKQPTIERHLGSTTTPFTCTGRPYLFISNDEPSWIMTWFVSDAYKQKK